MKVLIVNSVALNVGDAAILMGEVRALRAAFGQDLVIEVAEQTPNVANRLYPGLKFHAGLHPRHEWWPRWRLNGIVPSLRKRRTTFAVWLLRYVPTFARLLLSREQREHIDRIRRADVVVATGGTYFVEHYDFTAKSDEVNAALAFGKRTFLYTQSMGPFTKARSVKTMRRLAGCRGIFLRDEKSRGHLLETGMPRDLLSVHADAAFALDTPARPGRAQGARKRIAISVRSWSHARKGGADNGTTGASDPRDRYRRAVADAARTLAREGTEVVFLSTCQGVPEYWTDDSAYAEALVRELLPGEPNVRVDRSFRTPDQLAAELATFDLAIATRMHFAILSLVAHTPVVAIAYEFKSRELLRTMGMEALAVDFEDVSADWLVTSARDVLARGPALRDKVAAYVTRFRSDSLEVGVMIERRSSVGHGAR